MFTPSRRRFLNTLSLAGPAALLASRPLGAVPAASPPMLFPTQAPELAEEMVVVAHGNVARVKELVGRQPTLAKATWDWGFGDWETALGAASHVGSREIAELLLANGAHATIFSAAMLGDLGVVKSFLTTSPSLARTRGPHSITLLSHARAGGPPAKAVYEYLLMVDGADDRIAVQPVTDAEAASITGVYPFGVTPADRLEIAASPAQVQISRPGHYPRVLFHLGGLVFCPMGAESVRVSFDVTANPPTLTIRDPDVVLVATKKV